MAYGSSIIFVLKLAYCMSQLGIFAGWYSTQSSKLGELTWPFGAEEQEESVLITERVVVEPATLNESVESTESVVVEPTTTATSTTLNNFNVKED